MEDRDSFGSLDGLLNECVNRAQPQHTILDMGNWEARTNYFSSYFLEFLFKIVTII